MEKPRAIVTAVKLIWLDIGVSIVLDLYEHFIGEANFGELAVAFLVYVVIILFVANAISKRKKWGRTAFSVYFALTALGGVLALLFAPESMSNLRWIVAAGSAAIEIYIIYLLFQEESSRWFASRGQG